MTRRIAWFNESERPCQKGRDKCLNCEHYDRENGCKWLLDYIPYKVGEVVAVAQSYKSIHEEMMSGDYGDSKYDAFRCAVVAGTKGWTNKMFVRADLMPYRIKITDIKAEKLQDISDEDCLCEGINREVGYENGCYYFNDYEGFRTPRNAFAALINRINGKSTWEINPYVLVYKFELV